MKQILSSTKFIVSATVLIGFMWMGDGFTRLGRRAQPTGPSFIMVEPMEEKPDSLLVPEDSTAVEPDPVTDASDFVVDSIES